MILYPRFSSPITSSLFFILLCFLSCFSVFFLCSSFALISDFCYGPRVFFHFPGSYCCISNDFPPLELFFPALPFFSFAALLFIVSHFPYFLKFCGPGVFDPILLLLVSPCSCSVLLVSSIISLFVYEGSLFSSHSHSL